MSNDSSWVGAIVPNKGFREPALLYTISGVKQQL
jgi:hypothetical protein